MKVLRMVSFLYAICIAPEVLAQQPVTTFSIEKDCDIIAGSGYPRIDVNLDSLPLDSVGRVILHALNTTDETVELGQYFSGCACLKTTLSSTSVPPQSTVDINFEFTTPPKTKSSDQVVRLLIGPNKEQIARGLQVTMMYKISGLVVFRDGMIVATAVDGDEQLQFRAPLLVEEPARLEDITFRALGAIKDLKLELKPSPEGPFLECVIATKLLGPAGLTGELEVADQKTGMRDSLLCSLINKPIVTVAPFLLRLKWSESDQSFNCTAMVQYNAQQVSVRNEKPAQFVSEKEVKLYASMSGAKCDLDSKELAPGLFRARLKITPELPLEDFVKKENPDGVIWIVTTAGKDHTCKTSVSFQR